MTQIEVAFQRESLTDDFRLVSQQIDCAMDLKHNVFTAIEGAVSTACKERETFSVTAIVSIHQYLYVTGTYAKQCYKIILEQVRAFSGDELLEKPIELKV